MTLTSWVFGIGVWTWNILWHFILMDIHPSREAERRIFKRNLIVGLYMTGIFLADLLVTHHFDPPLRYYSLS